MNELDAILADATAAIDERFMRLPIYQGTPVYRERVYCYELYHQLRSRWPDPCPYTLNGEVDKRGHEVLANLGASNTIPDLLVHIPGDWNGNHAIIEVKPGRAKSSGIRKDVQTLSLFRKMVDYQRAIYLFYGEIPDLQLYRALHLVNDIPPIELWLHDQPGTPARQVAILRT